MKEVKKVVVKITSFCIMSNTPGFPVYVAALRFHNAVCGGHFRNVFSDLSKDSDDALVMKSEPMVDAFVVMLNDCACEKPDMPKLVWEKAPAPFISHEWETVVSAPQPRHLKKTKKE